MRFESLLILDPLQVLLIFNLLLYILVSLQQLIVFTFSQLKSLVKVSLQLLLKGIHLILLSLDEFGLCCNDLLMSLLHVPLALLDLEILAYHLNLMSLCVLLLLCKTLLDFLLVQKFRAKLKSQWQLLFKHLAVLFYLLGVAVFQLTQGLSVFLLSVKEVLVPLLIELLVLFDMGLFALLPLLCLIEDELLVTSLIVLMLQL